MKIDFKNVPPEHREEAEALAVQIAAAARSNPLTVFTPQPAPSQQTAFLGATTDIVAAFCGNQSGKSTIGAIKALVQLLPKDFVPEHLRPFRQFGWEMPTHGWALCPSEDKIYDSLVPALKKWCPPSALKGGSWDRAFNGKLLQLTFASGSTLTFKTYMQNPDRLGGATLHFVWYDEPPPQGHRDEAATRLLATGGPEWYTMTPLKSNTAWIRREIYRNREAPHITVLKWSMHDNPHLNDKKRTMLLASYKSDIWRAARENGDFMDIAGLVYGGIESCIVEALPSREEFKHWDHIWGIDPGIRNAAIIAGGFDRHGVDWIYADRLIQNGIPENYVAAIDELLLRCGLRRHDVLFVVDPAARIRSQTQGDTVQGELSRLGIHTANGVNDKEVGQQQIRSRIAHERIKILKTCYGLRADADEFAWEIDSEDDIGPADDAPFHRLATLRYQVMMRPWYPEQEERIEEERLGAPGSNQTPDLRYLKPEIQCGPMGPMS